jgi:hypothetical protein
MRSAHACHATAENDYLDRHASPGRAMTHAA